MWTWLYSPKHGRLVPATKSGVHNFRTVTTTPTLTLPSGILTKSPRQWKIPLDWDKVGYKEGRKYVNMRARRAKTKPFQLLRARRRKLDGPREITD